MEDSDVQYSLFFDYASVTFDNEKMLAEKKARALRGVDHYLSSTNILRCTMVGGHITTMVLILLSLVPIYAHGAYATLSLAAGIQFCFLLSDIGTIITNRAILLSRFQQVHRELSKQPVDSYYYWTDIRFNQRLFDLESASGDLATKVNHV